MKGLCGKQVSETNICNSRGYWLNPLTEKTLPKLILTLKSRTGRIMAQGHPGQIVHETPITKIN
jgi:hypothetical protein